MDDSMPVMTFEIPGKAVPYVRMTQRSKYVNKQAQRYLQWKSSFGWKVKEIMGLNGWYMIEPPTPPLHLHLRYCLKEPRTINSDHPLFDLSNVLKGIEDALQGIVYKNDGAIDSFTAWREFGQPADLIVFRIQAVKMI